ncbi:MAG: hypothetical protein D6732_05595 [Methanobacteriota archaeon]|nr:MAG: hypothetical protein D6732_05595 [Euryarchaeota archaeon]
MAVPFLVGLRAKEIEPDRTIFEVEYLVHKDHLGIELLGEGPELSMEPESSLLMEPTEERIQDMIFYRANLSVEDETKFLGRAFDSLGESFYEPGEYHVVRRRPNGALELVAPPEYIKSIEYEPAIPLDWNPDIDKISRQMLKIKKITNFPQFCIDLITYVHHWMYHPQVLTLRLDVLIRLLTEELRKLDSHSVDEIMRPVAVICYKILEDIRTFDKTQDETLLRHQFEKSEYRGILKKKLEELKENPIINPLASSEGFSFEQDSINRLKSLLSYL